MNAYRIAVVDDDANIRQIVCAYLQKEGYQTISLDSAEAAWELWQSSPPDLWVLDIMLPGMNGYELCKRLRAETETPILMISARDEEVDKILGLELGSDDYLTKPFSPRELVARINRALRRWEQMKNGGTGGTQTTNSKNDHADDAAMLILDAENRQVFWQGEEVDTTLKEFELLRFLADHPNRAFAREELLTSIWGHDFYGSDRAVDDLVRRIRKKMNGIPLETVWGYGYRLRFNGERII
jgi:two-component system response regulator CssR